MQVVIMLAIGGAAGAASFTHVHNAAVAHGQPEWIGWADAIVLELMSIASGLELRRRKRHQQPIGVPATILCTAVLLSLGAQVVEAEPSPIGWTAAVLPAAGFLAMVKIALGRTDPPAATTTPDRAAGPAVPDHQQRSRTVPDQHRDPDHTVDRDDGSRSRASSGSGSPADSPALVQAAIEAAAALASAGKPLSRKNLAAALRRDGHTLSNATASALVKVVRRQATHPTREHVPAPRGPSGSVVLRTHQAAAPLSNGED